MKIAEIQVVPYSLPFRQPYVTALGRIERREMVLLRLRSDDGLLGMGEAVPLSLRGGIGLAQVVKELERLGERDSLDETTLSSDAVALSPPARCAALTALLDLRGRRAAEETAPADTRLAPIKCNATLIAAEPAAVAADAERWASEGFSTFKLKLGAGDDVGQVRAAREALGPEARIRVDANAAWDVETARRTLRKIEPFDVELAEQPVATMEEAAWVSASTSIPLAGDESIEDRHDAVQAVKLGACKLAGLKLSKVGGPEEAIAIAEVLPSFVSSALDGPIGIAAAAQVAQTLDQAALGIPRFAHGLATQRLFSSTIASVECELREGMLYPPDGPGLGVEIDEAALAAHRI
jgi:o-succinylbenzoate synthase